MAVLLSGAGGLVYQLVWTRRLASVTSATHTAQALVLAVFMVGLAVGAYLGGRLSRRTTRPLFWYAVLELLAGALAAFSMYAFLMSTELQELASGVGLPPVVALFGQLAAVSLYLLLPTTLLGASLPLLIEQIDRHNGPSRKPQTAHLASLLYGWNTIGAAAGCLLAGYVAIERFGLTRTIYFGIGCAGLAALIALALHWWAMTAREPNEAVVSKPGNTVSDVSLTWVAAAALAGFVGLGAEVLWTRLVSLIVLNTAYALAQVMAAVLVGIACGAGLAAVIVRRGLEVEILLRMASLLLAGAAVALAAVPLVLLGVAGRYENMIQLASGPSPWSAILLAALALPSALLAVIFPVLVAVIHKRDRTANSFGILYGANTIGSVVGSLAVGFALLPLLGSQGSAILMVILVLALSAWLLVRAGGTGRTWGGLFTAAGVSFGLVFSVNIPLGFYELRLEEGWEIMELREGALSDVMVAQDRKGVRRLWINSSWVAGTEGGHRVLGHLPALFVEQPDRVLGIALGTGQTFASILRHGVHELHCVELDAGVIELSRRWFTRANDGLFDKPAVTLHHNDGRAFMRATDRRFDLVILEPLQAWTAGTTNLYTREFYEEAQAILSPGGLVAQWIPFYGQSLRDTRAMVRSAVDVFPQASLWLDDHDGILLLQTEPFALQPNQLSIRIRDRGVRTELARNNVGDLVDLLSLFLIGPEGVRRWSEGVPLLSDDHPFLEFSAARHLGTPVYHDIIGSLIPVLDDPMAYAPEDALSGVGDGPLVMASSVRFAILSARALSVDLFAERASVLEGGLSLVPESKLLQKRYADLILSWAASAGRGPDDAGAVREIYQRGLDHASGMGEVAVELAILHGRQGDHRAAHIALEHASTDPRVREAVMQVRRRLRVAEFGRAAVQPLQQQ